MPDDSGSVFVLNATTQAISLRVNNYDAGTVPKGKEDPTAGFVLGVLKVARSSAPAPGNASFGSGSGSNANTMEVTAPGQDVVYHNIVIDPGKYPLNNNLQMYVFYSAAILCQDGLAIWGSYDPSDKVQHPAKLTPADAKAKTLATA
jgi:hypothetical protein